MSRVAQGSGRPSSIGSRISFTLIGWNRLRFAIRRRSALSSAGPFTNSTNRRPTRGHNPGNRFVVPRDNDFLTPRNPFQQLAEPRLRFECRNGVHETNPGLTRK